jgi:hypothetical protein
MREDIRLEVSFFKMLFLDTFWYDEVRVEH